MTLASAINQTFMHSHMYLNVFDPSRQDTKVFLNNTKHFVHVNSSIPPTTQPSNQQINYIGGCIVVQPGAQQCVGHLMGTALNGHQGEGQCGLRWSDPAKQHFGNQSKESGMKSSSLKR